MGLLPAQVHVPIALRPDEPKCQCLSRERLIAEASKKNKWLKNPVLPDGSGEALGTVWGCVDFLLIGWW